MSRVPQRLVHGRRYAGLPVDSWNWMLDAIERLQAGALQLPLDDGGEPPGDPPSLVPVAVENHTGEDLPVFGVVSLGEARLDVAGDEATRLGPLLVKAEKADPERPLAIVQEPLEDGAIGAAMLMGATVVKLDVTAESDTTAGAVKDDQAKLKTGSGPARVVWKEAGTGEKWGIVLVGGGGGSVDAQIVFIDRTLPAASWDDATDQLRPGREFYALAELDSASGEWKPGADLVEISNFFTTPVEISLIGSRALIGTAINGVLFNVDCQEISATLPP